jgi:hypothetical protein
MIGGERGTTSLMIATGGSSMVELETKNKALPGDSPDYDFPFK